MKALIYQSELEYISKCILDYPNIETGGDLFGFWTYSGFPVIQYAIGPGPNTHRTVAFFKQDKEFLIKNGNFLNKHHGLQHLGNWHSHHQLGLSHPSSHDSYTVSKAIRDNNLNQFFLIIGTIENSETTINGFQYYNESQGNYQDVSWVVLQGYSPIRKELEETIESDLLYDPNTKVARVGHLKTTSLSNTTTYQEPLIYNEELWYTSEKGKKFVKIIHNSLSSDFDIIKMYQTVHKRFELKLVISSIETTVLFPKDFPTDKVLFYGGNEIITNHINKLINSNINKTWIDKDKE